MDPIILNVSYLSRDNVLSGTEEISLDHDQTQAALLEKVAKLFDTSPDDYDLYLGTNCLNCQSGDGMLALGIRSGCRLYAIQKKSSQSTSTEKVEMPELQNAMHGLHLMFHNAERKRRAKSPIIRLFEDEEAMKSIISSIEGLTADRTALDILESKKLFQNLVHPKNSKTLLENHPCLASAIVTMWQSLTTSPHYNAEKSPSTSQGLMEVEDNALQPPSSSDPPSSANASFAGRGIITSTQLAAAIAQATSPGGAPMFNYSSYNTPSSSNVQSPMNVGSVNRSGESTPADGRATTSQQQTQTRPLITPDVFSQAMQQALMAGSPRDVADSAPSDGAVGGAGPVSEEAMQAGLNQLRAMGIADDAASRQALTATNGNVEAAVNLLFSGN